MSTATPAEIALIEENRRLRSRIAELERERQIPREIIEKSPVMISIVRAPDFVYELVNPAFQALAPGKEFLGRRFADVWAEVPDPLVDILQNVIETGKPFKLEDAPYTIQRGPGMPPEVVHVSYSWIPLFDPEGKPDRVLTLAHEVTGAVRQRQQLAESNEALIATKERLQQVLASITEGYYVLDNQWRFVEMNAVAERHFERPAAELLAKNIWEETGVQAGSELYDNFHKAAASHRPLRFEAQSTINPGYWAELHLCPRDSGLDVYFHDITDRKRAEKALAVALAEAVNEACLATHARR
jgi:PAS domain-containing protein